MPTTQFSHTAKILYNWDCLKKKIIYIYKL
uniref:Uncharacterized protein n=1 Tax=Anguilla anguilla TaxID=7936 RepID=A0A0E9Q2C3_ANGAN